MLTVCSKFQFTEVNIRLEMKTVPSEMLLLFMGMVTFAIGLVSSLTVKDDFDFDSVVM